MCGIVGLFCKSPELEPQLGSYLGAMLAQMDERGPDSAGVAVYRDPVPDGWSKLMLYSADPEVSWDAVRAELAAVFGGASAGDERARHMVMSVEAPAEEAEAWVRRNLPDLRIMSAGRVIEIYKEVGRPATFVEEFRLSDFAGTHGLGHTRMATERPLPRPQRVALESQPAARAAAPRGDRVPDGERHGGRGGVPRVAAARGGDARSGARGLPRGSRRLLHVPRRDRRRVCGAA